MFTVSNNNIIVCDPSRKKDHPASAVIQNCVNGVWEMTKIFDKLSDILSEIHIASTYLPMDASWETYENSLFTNSKLIGGFDFDLYPENGCRDIFPEILSTIGDDLGAIWSSDIGEITRHQYTDWEIGNHTLQIHKDSNNEVDYMKIILG